MKTYIDQELTECMKIEDKRSTREENIIDIVSNSKSNLMETLVVIASIRRCCCCEDAIPPDPGEARCLGDDLKAIRALSYTVLCEVNNIAKWIGCL